MGGRPSRRAARSAWIVEGTGSSARSDAATQRSPSRVSSASSTSIATSSSAKSGLPSAALAILDSAAGGRGARSSRFEISSRHSASLSGSRRIDVALRLPAPQPGRVSKQLRSRDADEQDREIAREVGDVLDQVEERRLGPVEVVDHDDERPCSRERLEQPPDGPEGLLARPSSRAAEPERTGHALERSARLSRRLRAAPRSPLRDCSPESSPSARVISRTISASGQ